MSDQPEALRLADALRDGMPYDEAEIENELRRQHGEIKSMQSERLQSDRRLAAYEPLLEALRHIANHDLRGADLTVCGHIAHALVGRARAAVKAVESPT